MGEPLHEINDDLENDIEEHHRIKTLVLPPPPDPGLMVEEIPLNDATSTPSRCVRQSEVRYSQCDIA